MTPLAWDAGIFSQAFPEFGDVGSSPVYGTFWSEAGLLCDNSGSGPITDPDQLRLLLNLLVAHIATIQLGPNGQSGGSGLVGRVSQAKEGSISVATSINGAPYNDEWYLQTPYGMRYLQIISNYRSFRYYPDACPRRW